MTTALKITIKTETLPGVKEKDGDQTLIVNACGVSGGDRVIEMLPDSTIEIWTGSKGRISLFPKAKDDE